MLLRDIPRKIRLNSPVRILKLKFAGWHDGKAKVGAIAEDATADATYAGRLANSCKIRMDLECDACAHSATKLLPALLKHQTDYDSKLKRLSEVLRDREAIYDAAYHKEHEGDQGVSDQRLDARKTNRAQKAAEQASNEATALVRDLDQIAKAAVDDGLYLISSLEGALRRQIEEQANIYRSDALCYARALQRKTAFCGEVSAPPVHSDCLKRYRAQIPAFNFTQHLSQTMTPSEIDPEKAKTLTLEEVPDVF